MKINILHLTDLHLSDPDSHEEKLRRGFYRDYLLSLRKEVLKTAGKIDIIFCTGDIVDRGKVANFSHAKAIFDYLLELFEVEEKNLFFCPGNHDVQVQDANKADISAYDAFVKNYISRPPIHETECYQLLYLEEWGFYVLSFNSVAGAEGLLQTDPSSGGIYIAPAQWQHRQIDELFTVIDRVVPGDKPLFVLSHFPMQVSPRFRAILEEEGWIKKHLWAAGAIIVERMFTRREHALTVYLFGDGHLPDLWSENQCVHYTMTGQVGGNFTNPTFRDKTGEVVAYNKTNEVKIISIENSRPETIFYTAVYRPAGFAFDAQHGNWYISAAGAVNGYKPASLPPQPRVAPTYKLSNFRKFLESALTDTELNSLCMDHFPEVNNRLGDGMNKLQKINLLLDFCRRNIKLDILLEKMQEMNEDQFQRFKPYSDQ